MSLESKLTSALSGSNFVPRSADAPADAGATASHAKKKKKQKQPRWQSMAVHGTRTNLQLWEEDGVDHINVSPMGNHPLGRKLAQATPHKINHKIFGRFACLRGFALWLEICLTSPRADELRTLSGSALQKAHYSIIGDMKRTNGQHWQPSIGRHYCAVVTEAFYGILDANPDILRTMYENTLTFDMYHVDRDTGLRSRFTGEKSMWYINMLNDVSDYMLDNDGALVTHLAFADSELGPDETIYDAFMPEHQRRFLAAKAQAEAQAKAEAQAHEAAKAEALAKEQAAQTVLLSGDSPMKEVDVGNNITQLNFLAQNPDGVTGTVVGGSTGEMDNLGGHASWAENYAVYSQLHDVVLSLVHSSAHNIKRLEESEAALTDGDQTVSAQDASGTE